MNKIKQVWTPYWEWEDWHAGMWRKSDTEKLHLQQAIEFTGDHIKYGNAMLDVVFAWPRTMLNSLTNPGINKRAFLGHCAVTFKLAIPEYITRNAWKLLTQDQRDRADKIAQETIEAWREDYANILQRGNNGVTIMTYQTKALAI